MHALLNNGTVDLVPIRDLSACIDGFVANGIDLTVLCPIGWPFGNPWVLIVNNDNEVIDNLANDNSDNENNKNSGTGGENMFVNHFIVWMWQSVIGFRFQSQPLISGMWCFSS